MLAKDPNRRRSRSGSRARVNGVRPDSKLKRSFSSSQVSDRSRGQSFVLYVEGARDREILECWARRVDSGLARCIERNTVILGGRRPARAMADFQKRGGAAAGYSGLIVLDRDDHVHAGSMDGQMLAGDSLAMDRSRSAGASNPIQRDAGLEVFVWSLRHIESYLLVPVAIRRMLRLAADDRTVENFIEVNSINDVDTGDAGENEARARSTTRVPGSLHAKRVLGAGGLLSEALGAELRAGDIARAMRIEDLHGDVHELFDRIGALSGVAVKRPEVVIRRS